MEMEGFTFNLIFAIFASSFGSSFQHGWNTGVINPPAEVIQQWIRTVVMKRGPKTMSAAEADYNVTHTWAIIASIFCVGGMFGGLLTGWFANAFGRKGGILINNVFVILAVICMGLAKPLEYYELLIVARFIIGVNSGLNAGLVPMYLAEISPVHLRGAIASVYQLGITVSILLSNVIGMKSIMGTADLWPMLFCLTLVPGIVQILTLPFCPESPKHLLLSKNNDEGAQKNLVWLRKTDDVSKEMKDMRSEVEAVRQNDKVTLVNIVATSSLRRPLMISLMVMLAQQLSGINAIMFYSTAIFQMANFTENTAQLATMTVSIVNVLMTIVSVLLVEKAGRKTLLLVGFFGMCLDTAVLAASFDFKEYTEAKIVLVGTIYVYIILFAAGAGSIPWFLVSELFNQSARPLATSIAVATNWAANFLVTLTFPPAQEVMGPHIFYVYAGIQLLFAFYILMKVPETKNKSIEEISSSFQ